MVFHGMEELIGKTPLLELHRLGAACDLKGRILAKLEAWNPAGSVKDRVALTMLTAARSQGLLSPNSVIIEPTSGNTGIALCAIAAAWGLRCIIVMPENMSRERQRLMEAYGAQVVLTPAAEGMAGAIAKAHALGDTTPGSFLPGQFTNEENPRCHQSTTGPELWQDTQGQLDVFLAGLGTGGTITGVARYLAARNPGIRIVAVDPATPTDHGIQGIGAGFPSVFPEPGLIHRHITVTREQAVAAARLLARTEGLLAGISSGAVLHGAITLAALPEYTGKTLVTLFPDSGERYLSTDLWA